MSQTIQIRRGTKAQLDTLMATTPMLAGELGFTTDTKEVFCSDGTTAHQIGGVIVGANLAARPAAGVSGRMYLSIDTSLTYVDNGTSWVAAGISSLDDLADGTIYGRVKNTELESGQVKTIRAVTAATDISGDTLDTHLNADELHREINDVGTGVTDLLSAQKIHAMIQAAQSGLDAKESVVAGTTVPLPAVVYNSNVITASANGSLPVIDGITLTVGDRLLVKDQVAALQNGIYNVTSIGDGATKFVLTRSSDADNDPGSEVTSGMYCFIESGTINANAGWLLTTTDNIILGTTALTFTQFNGAGQLVGGDGITKDGNTFNINVSDFAGTGLENDGTENLRLATQGNGIAGGNGSVISVASDTTGGANLAKAINVVANGVGVKVDDTTIEGDDTTGQLKVKDLGISTDKLAATSVTAAKLGADILGTGLVGGNGAAVSLAATVAGAGLTHTAGVLDVVGGNGIDVAANGFTLVPDVTTGATVAPAAVAVNGLGVTVDNTSIIHDAGELQVSVVDGGTF